MLQKLFKFLDVCFTNLYRKLIPIFSSYAHIFGYKLEVGCSLDRLTRMNINVQILKTSLIILTFVLPEKNRQCFLAYFAKFNKYFHILQLLLLRGYAFNHSADFETVRIMKEKLCYVGYDIEQEQKLALETTVLVETYTVSTNVALNLEIGSIFVT